jgi:hypothetical protein
MKEAAVKVVPIITGVSTHMKMDLKIGALIVEGEALMDRIFSTKEIINVSSFDQQPEGSVVQH